MSLKVPRTSVPTQGSQPVDHTLLNPIVKFYQLLLPLQVVEALYAEWHTDGLEVWLIVNGVTEADRERIYEQEWVLMQTFPALGLDVHLLDRQETDPNIVADLERVDVFLRFPETAHA